MTNNISRLVAKKKDIWHKVEMGILFDAYYDTETTDLSKRFAEITQFGGVITDLAGNILHREDLRAKISPYTVISPFAWLVQRLRLEDVEKGDPKSVFMGKVKNSLNIQIAFIKPHFQTNSCLSVAREFTREITVSLKGIMRILLQMKMGV